MKVNVEIKTGKEWVYRAMLATKNKKPSFGKLKDETWFKMLRAKHSPIEEFVLWIDAVVPERVHTHIVKHEEIGKYVATSRPDIKGNTIQEGFRSLSLSINAKRMIEIAEQRLCTDAWIDTRMFIKEVVNNIPDETLKNLCAPPCVRCNCCIGLSKCDYMRTDKFKVQRDYFENGG